jgi:hypothetical protein
MNIYTLYVIVRIAIAFIKMKNMEKSICTIQYQNSDKMIVIAYVDKNTKNLEVKGENNDKKISSL